MRAEPESESDEDGAGEARLSEAGSMKVVDMMIVVGKKGGWGG